MDVRASVLWIIVGTGLVTLLPRMLPLAALHRVALPPVVVRWLGYVPVAALAALLGQAVALTDGRPELSLRNPALLAVIPTLLVAAGTRSLIGTVVSGISAMALLRWML